MKRATGIAYKQNMRAMLYVFPVGLAMLGAIYLIVFGLRPLLESSVEGQILTSAIFFLTLAGVPIAFYFAIMRFDSVLTPLRKTAHGPRIKGP